MAVTYGFFNSVNGDRKYNADTMSEFYTGICTQGVFQHVDNGLAVSAGTGLTVNVASGRAIIQGHWVKNDAALTLSIDAASATYARIDAVVIRYSASNRNIQIVVKTGTPAASPSAPSMTRAGGVYEMCLAYVNVAANATSVTVTDKRSNSSVCGWAAVAQATSGEVDQMLNDMKTGFDGVTYNSPGAAVRACDQLLQDEIDTNDDRLREYMGDLGFLDKYLYKQNCFVANSSKQEVADKKWNVYRVTVPAHKVLVMKWSPVDGEQFWYSTDAYLNSSNIFYQMSGTTYVRNYEPANTQHGPSFTGYMWQTNYNIAMFWNTSDSDWVIAFNCLKIRIPTVKVHIANDLPSLNYVSNFTVGDVFTSHVVMYKNEDSSLVLYKNSTANVLTFPVKANDVFKFAGKVTAWNIYGTFIGNDGTIITIRELSTYTVPGDGIMSIPLVLSGTPLCTYLPIGSIRLEYKNILDVPESENAYNGLLGVAFGTSLTYRSQTTGGYLNYLPTLSGMTFDNQGIGNSQIVHLDGYGDILAAIKAYTGYANKNVCLLEGFVNDWGRDSALGQYTDTVETTVCGAVRSAINYIKSQNASIKIFLILDHFGKYTSSFDCSSTAKNGDDLTQYEYYQEVSKVAESLGCIVIKEYALSDISENSPQYLIDDIHLNALGAEQSAKTIWSVMKSFYPNATS